MSLFKGQRDMSLFRKINYELITDIVDTEIEFYKIVVESSDSNIYDESVNKYYYDPVIVPCILNKDEPNFSPNETGQQSYTQTATFNFLRDMMVERNLVPEVGDIVKYDNEYFEIDSVIENNYFGNSNPDTAKTGPTHGYNVNFICNSHKTDESITLFRNRRSGNTYD